MAREARAGKRGEMEIPGKNRRTAEGGWEVGAPVLLSLGEGGREEDVG